MHDLTHRLSATRFMPRPLPFLFGLVAISALSGCGKGEKIPTTQERLSSVQQKQETQPDFYVPRKTVDYMTDLKSLKDTPAKPEPSPARAESVKSVDTKPALQESRIAAATAPAPTQAAPPPATTPPAAAAPAGNVVASSAPTARPSPKQEVAADVSVVSREQPAFPREALRAGIESGTVRARVTINAAGEVTNVARLQSQPARVFDRAVQQALGRWKFNTGADGRTLDTEVGFKAAN